MCDETQNLNETESETFSDTEFDTFFRYQFLSDTDTFFDTYKKYLMKKQKHGNLGTSCLSICSI